MLLDEFLISLGVEADTNSLRDFERGLDEVTDSAEQTSTVVGGLSDSMGKFRGAIGVVGAAWTAFTGTLAGAWGYFHGTIMQLDELIESKKLLFDVTKDQLEQQKKYKESVETLGKQFGSLRAALALGYLPTMLKMIEAVNKFLDANKEAIQNGILKFLNSIKLVMQSIVNTVRFIDLIIDSTIGWKNALLILGGVLIWVKRAMLLAFVTNPVMWIIAAIAGLILLIDDFMTYLDGGESEFADFWGGMMKWIDKAKEKWDEFSDTAKGGFKTLAIGLALLMPMFGGFVGTLKILASVFWLVGKAMAMTPIGRIITLVSALVFVIIDLIRWLNGGESQFASFWQAGANAWNKLVDGAKTAIASIKDFFGSGIDWIIDKFSKLPSLVNGIVSKLTFGLSDKIGAAVSRTSNRVVNNTSTTNANFNVNGAVSPQATASAINSNLNSITQSNMGGMAKA